MSNANHAVSASDRNREFLELVLPWPGPQDTGFINLHAHLKNPDPNKNGGKDFVVGWPHNNINDFLSRAKWVETAANYYDVWFCTSLQKEHYDEGWRTQGNQARTQCIAPQGPLARHRCQAQQS